MRMTNPRKRRRGHFAIGINADLVALNMTFISILTVIEWCKYGLIYVVLNSLHRKRRKRNIKTKSHTKLNKLLNSSRRCDATIRPWSRPSLVQIMRYRLFGAKPLSEPKLSIYTKSLSYGQVISHRRTNAGVDGRTDSLDHDGNHPPN